VLCCIDRQVEDDEPIDSFFVPHHSGWASKSSTLGDITINYVEDFGYDDCDPDSLTVGEVRDDEWTVWGVSVVDEDGDELIARELATYLTPDFSSIDYSVLDIERVTDFDVGEDIDDIDMETFTLKVDNAPSLRFTGELLAEAISSGESNRKSYSGDPGRWTVLELYKTIGGKFVCHQIGRSVREGERNRFSSKVCETHDEVIAFFGHRWLAKELYDEAGIDDVVEVD
jgi:hypothetical protein